jgi:putative ABC transport system permease protein
MLGVRWHKVLTDLFGNKTRTLLIVLSITVGLFAIGMILNSRIVLAEEMAKSYAAINPSSGTIRTVEAFDADFLRSIRRMPGVKEADARAHVGLRYRKPANAAAAGGSETGRWKDIQLFAAPDYDKIQVNKIKPLSGSWPPADHELLLERSSLELLGAKEGDWLIIETADLRQRKMRIAGVVHDFCQVPSSFDDMARGYISFDTLEWLGVERDYNELHIITQGRQDKKETLPVINSIKDRLEKNGFTIPMSMAAEPGELPLNDYLQSILLLLGVIGFLSLFLSAFLIINTISALVTQQIRVIGIMKAIGARTGQIIGLYMVLVIIYGLVALAIAVPLGAIGGQLLCQFLAGIFNFDLTQYRVTPEALGLQVLIGLLVPIASALFPILTVTRITPAAAMSGFGAGMEHFGAGFFDRLFITPSAFLVRLLSRPLMLSLRNTFRRKGRLALTLITLTLGGAIFIGIFSVRSSLYSTLDQIMGMYRSDIWLNFAEPQRGERIARQAQKAEGVTAAQSWERMPVRRVRPDGSESGNLLLFAPQLDGDLLHPVLLEGRWLEQGDRRAVVLSTGTLEVEPDLKLGDDLTLKIEGRKTTFHVVGIALGMGVAPFIYTGYDDLTTVTHKKGQTTGLMVAITQHDNTTQALTATMLEEQFKDAGTRVSSVQLVSEENSGTEMGFNLIIGLALMMAFLLAIVGGFGLMGTLSINVLERTREIGVLRAIGASDMAVARIFIVEGMVIGGISWLFGALLAIPFSGLLSQALGDSFLKTPLTYGYSLGGALLWLVTALALSAIASYLPARNATRLSVREVLAYE